jgi:hypothetical protein
MSLSLKDISHLINDKNMMHLNAFNYHLLTYKMVINLYVFSTGMKNRI